MKQFVQQIAIFGEKNPWSAAIISIAIVLMIAVSIKAFQKVTEFSFDEVKSSVIVASILTLLFILGAVVGLHYAPTASLSNQGAQVLMAFTVIYTFFVVRFSDEDVWEQGIIP